jgi:hypothetical protein
MKDIDKMNVAELADALQRFEFDMLNEAVANRLRAIHEETRWIPVSERMPTHEDADIRGKVMWYFWGEHYESRFWNLRSDYGATHWKRITPPEDKP